MNTNNKPVFGSDPVSPNTTYVQADPSNFRAVVQKLTGASDDTSSSTSPHRIPITLLPPPRFSDAMGPRRRPAFKLHERRISGKKLDLISLHRHQIISDQESPVSTLDFFSPRQHQEDEKGLCLTRPGSDPPELLVLFPLHSPRDANQALAN